MRTQVALATEALRGAERRPGATDRDDAELAAAFEKVYAEAVAEAGRGRTVTPAEQLLRAGEATGRRPRPEPYLERLSKVVASLPFARAPYALELLATLEEEGYHLGLISNTIGEPGAYLRPVLRSMGLDRYLRAVVFSDELPWTKPSPEIFRRTLGLLDSTPGDAVHVGDGWSDIEGARRAGLRGSILFTGLQEYGARYKALFLPATWDRPATDHVAERLDQVVDLIHAILPTGRSG